jgi:methylase of polypeptide subunit release factors
LAVLRRLFTQHGYEQASGSGSGDRELVLRKAPADSALRTLLTLFSSDHHITSSDASELFPGALLDELLGAGLVQRDGDTVSGAQRITALDGLFIAHDKLPPNRPDYVGGINPAARTLASLTMRRRVDSALDLCTGSGYQAMLLARHASRVVATDLIPRALALTRLNAELNEVTNIECREGSLLAPVEGERFDLIACNPPFIISPDMAYAFRDGGAQGDSLSEAVVRGIPRQLADGGIAAMLVNWGLRHGEDWTSPGRRWLAGSGCDAVLLRYGTADPLAYAALWNSHLAQTSPTEYRSALDRWPRYLAGLQFEEVVHCGVVLHKCSGGARVAAFDAVGPQGDATDQLERIFANLRTSLSESAIEGQHLRLVDGHRLDQLMTFNGGGYRIDPATLSLNEHCGVLGTVPADLVPFLLGLTSGGSIREVASETASGLGVGPEAYLRAATELAAELLERGLVEAVPES